MARYVSFAAASALAAAISLPVMSAAAAPAPETGRGPIAYDASASTVHQAYGWRDSSRDGVYYPRGVAIGGPGSRDDREDDDPRWAVPDDRQDYSNRQGYDYQAPQRDLGLDRIAGLCVDVVERGRSRVNLVDGVSRDRDGWSISGALYDGSGFSCRIGNDGQLQDVHFGRRDAVVPLTSGREDFGQPAVQRAPSAVQRGDNFAPPAPRTEAGEQADRYAAPSPMPPRVDDGSSYAAIPAAAPSAQDQDRDNYATTREPPALSGAPAVRGPAAEPATPARSSDEDRADNYAAPGELPAQPAGARESASSPAPLAKPADPAPSAVEAPAPVPTDADDASAPAADDEEVLPPADTSEALPVDPDKSPAAATPAQPQNDGRYGTSQAPDFSETV